MGYPTSVFSPATRSDGQTITAAIVNDIQAEVTAVENALLGTITHSVNVSGASTLATLQCAGSTFSVRPVMPPPEAARVGCSTADLTNNAALTVEWINQEFLTKSSLHSTVTNSSRFTPQSTGVFAVSAHVLLITPYGASSGNLRIRILDSSGGVVVSGMNANSSHVDNPMVAVSGLKRFDVVGGWVSVEAIVRDGSTHSLSTQSFFSIHKL